jgi:hypothetical protein
MKSALLSSFASIALIAATLSGCAASADHAGNRYASPSKVFVLGSDIDTGAHSKTLQLRDALEHVIAGKPGIGPGMATSIYIPDDVRLSGAGFRYRVLLVDAQLRTLRTVQGTCRRDIEACATAIASSLAAQR